MSTGAGAPVAKPRPLAGRTVVVTRAAEQAGTLSERLEALGAAVVSVATIAIEDPADGGAALAEACAHLARYDWVVVSSPNGAARLAGALTGGWPEGGPRLAVIGPGTQAAATALGLRVDLVPERFVAEGLVAAFPSGPSRVLVAQAAGARPVLGEGLRAKGHEVDVVAAYQTVPAVIAQAVMARIAPADAVTFTSASTVHNLLAATGELTLPPVVCIGPIAATAAEEQGLRVAAVADPHTLDGLVNAVVGALS